MDELYTVRIYCRLKDIRIKKFLCLAGAVFNLIMTAVHAYKKIFMNAYIPKKTALVYLGALFIFLMLTILLHYISIFKLCRDHFVYRGKKYNAEEYSYTFNGSKLILYKGVGESIVPEYTKEIEVGISERKKEDTEDILKTYYTEKPEWANAHKSEDGSKTRLMIARITDVICAAAGIVLLTVFANRGYIINEWEMTAADDGIEITAYNGYKTEIVIPSRVEGVDIVALKDFGNTSSKKKSGVRSVVIPETVKRISGDSFNTYKELEQITYTTSLSDVSASSFQGCPSLKIFEINGTQNAKDVCALPVNFPDRTKLILNDCSISDGAFAGCDTIRSVTIRGNKVSIGSAAFEKCRGLEKVFLFGDVVSIGESAFSGCRYLSSIDLPDGLKTIGDRAFEDCMLFSTVRLPESLESIGSYVFSGSGLKRLTIPANAVTELGILGNCFDLEEVTLLGSTDTITEELFKGCRNLKRVVLPEGVKSIGDSAFLSCSTLKEIVLPQGLKNIGDHAFCGCRSLKSIDLYEGLETIGGSAFEMSGLTRVEIPEGCSVIAENAFSDCADLQFVRLPDSLTILGEAAFHNCPVSSVFLPDNLTTFDEKAFLDKKDGNLILICYTPDCKAKDQIEAAYDGMRNSRRYYSLLTVADREEYEKRCAAQDFSKDNEEAGKEDVIAKYELEPVIIEYDNRITRWEAYHAQSDRLVPITAEGITLKMTLYGDGSGTIFLSTDYPAASKSSSFTLEREDEYSMIMTFDDPDGFYVEDLYKEETYEVQFYTDQEGNLYQWMNMDGEEIWFLQAE